MIKILQHSYFRLIWLKGLDHLSSCKRWSWLKKIVFFWTKNAHPAGIPLYFSQVQSLRRNNQLLLNILGSYHHTVAWPLQLQPKTTASATTLLYMIYVALTICWTCSFIYFCCFQNQAQNMTLESGIRDRYPFSLKHIQIYIFSVREASWLPQSRHNVPQLAADCSRKGIWMGILAADSHQLQKKTRVALSP